MFSSQGESSANVLKANLEALEKLKRRITISKKKTANVFALEQEIIKLPAAEEVDAILINIKEELLGYVNSEKERLRNDFDSTLTQYISGLKSANAQHRIIDQYRLRTGILMMEASPDRVSARVLYNDAPIVDWSIVTSVKDYIDLEAEAKTKIEKYALPEDAFIVAFHSAVNELSLRGKSDTKLVKLQNVYPEIIVQKVRQSIMHSKGRGRIAPLEYPYFAFLFNLDKFKTDSSSLPQEKQLTFYTGSQVETESFGVTLNGLDPEQPYKRFCFVAKR